MNNEKEDLRDLFAEARAIYLAMSHSLITYQQVKFRTKPTLKRINDTIELLAKEYKVKPKYITFQDLGVNI